MALQPGGVDGYCKEVWMAIAEEPEVGPELAPTWVHGTQSAWYRPANRSLDPCQPRRILAATLTVPEAK